MQGNILSWVIFAPLLFIIPVLFLPKDKQNLSKFFALAGTGFSFILSLVALLGFKVFDAANFAGQLNYVERVSWINFSLGSWGNFSSEYYLGLDGLNVYLFVLSTFVLLIGVISSWNQKVKQKGYFSLYLVLSTAVLGCFCALDMLLFYAFFEFMLLPMYFLIGIWGGVNREYAAIKFFIYTLFGSVLILLVMIGLYLSVIDPIQTAIASGLIANADQFNQDVLVQIQTLLAQGEIATKNIVHTFDLLAMADAGNFIPDSIFAIKGDATILGYAARMVGFVALFIGFCIKLPMVPVHTWLPDAHVQAPTAISVILAGILLKVGGYGLIRIVYPVFPAEGAASAYWVSFFAALTIIYAAYVSLAQKDLKRLIAYSSVSHMGFVVLGIASYTTEGVSGAIYQMVSHGLISPMLFLVAGVVYDRTGSLKINQYKGIVNKMPFFTAFVTVAFFASLGLPGFSGFIAEVFVFLGAFSSSATNGLVPQWMAIVSLFGLIITAGYYLWALQRMFFGKFWTADNTITDKFNDLTAREYLMLIPLALITVLLGVMPSLILDNLHGSVDVFVQLLNAYL